MKDLLLGVTIMFGACVATATELAFQANFPDPNVIRAPNGRYYAYATQGAGSNIQILESGDLMTWQRQADALPNKPLWASHQQNFWSPDVSFHDGIYFMYFAAEANDSRFCIGVATSKDPAGPFRPSEEPIVCGAGIVDIDPAAFDDPASGARLLYFGSGGSPLRVIWLTKDRLHQDHRTPEASVLNPSERDYEHLIEGASVVFQDGYYFLFYSGDNCCHSSPHYAIRVARSRSPFGPFEKAERPFIEADKRWLAPGHNSLIQDASGQLWTYFAAIDRRDLSPERGNGGVPSRPLVKAKVSFINDWPVAR